MARCYHERDAEIKLFRRNLKPRSLFRELQKDTGLEDGILYYYQRGQKALQETQKEKEKMTLKIQNKPAAYFGLVIAVCGMALISLGDIGWLFGWPVVAVGIGLVAAGFTRCKP